MNQTLKSQLLAMKADLDGPLGQIPFDRAIQKHMALFAALRASGSTWSQIANALSAAGIRKPDGHAWSSDHLRGAVARQLRRSFDPNDPINSPISVPSQPSTPDDLPAQAETRKPKADRDHSSILEKLERTKLIRRT